MFYQRTCIICRDGDVFNSDQVQPIRGKHTCPIVERIENPTYNELMELNRKLTDKLNLLASPKELIDKIAIAEAELKEQKIKPTTVLIGEYLNRSRECIGKTRKKYEKASIDSNVVAFKRMGF